MAIRKNPLSIIYGFTRPVSRVLPEAGKDIKNRTFSYVGITGQSYHHLFRSGSDTEMFAQYPFVYLCGHWLTSRS
jgi:hypothetical protein